MRRENFYRFFKQVQTPYDILSPDAFLRPFMDDYQILARLYGLIINAYCNTYVDRELTAKTRELLRQRTTSGEIEPPGAIHQLGPEELEAIRGSSTSDRTKILNLRKIIAIAADKEGTGSVLRLIAERAMALAEAYEDRQIETQEALARFEDLANEYINADEERRRLGLEENAFAVYTVLKPHVQNLSPSQAKELDAVFKDYPDHHWDEDQERRLRAKLYKPVRSLVGTSKMVEVTDSLLRLRQK